MPRKKKVPLTWPTDESEPKKRTREEGVIDKRGLVLMSCSKRFTTFKFEETIKFFEKDKDEAISGKLLPGSTQVYLLMHDNCRHSPPVTILKNDKHPGVPHIFTSMYFKQCNGVYRNAIGEILTEEGSFAHSCTGNELVQLKNVVATISDQNESYPYVDRWRASPVRKPGRDFELFKKFKEEWVSLKD